MMQFRITFTGLFVYALNGDAPSPNEVQVLAPEAAADDHFGYLQLRHGRFADPQIATAYPDGRFQLGSQQQLTVGDGSAVDWLVPGGFILEGWHPKLPKLAAGAKSAFRILLSGGAVTPGRARRRYKVGGLEVCLALHLDWYAEVNSASISLRDTQAGTDTLLGIAPDDTGVHLVIGHVPFDELLPKVPPTQMKAGETFHHANPLYGMLTSPSGGVTVPQIVSAGACGPAPAIGLGSIRHCLGLVASLP